MFLETTLKTTHHWRSTLLQGKQKPIGTHTAVIAVYIRNSHRLQPPRRPQPSKLHKMTFSAWFWAKPPPCYTQEVQNCTCSGLQPEGRLDFKVKETWFGALMDGKKSLMLPGCWEASRGRSEVKVV